MEHAATVEAAVGARAPLIRLAFIALAAGEEPDVEAAHGFSLRPDAARAPTSPWPLLAGLVRDDVVVITAVGEAVATSRRSDTAPAVETEVVRPDG